jgi:hypothetical protein
MGTVRSVTRKRPALNHALRGPVRTEDAKRVLPAPVRGRVPDGEGVQSDRRLCRFVDVVGGEIRQAPERYKKLRNDVEAASEQISELWKSVTTK